MKTDENETGLRSEVASSAWELTVHEITAQLLESVASGSSLDLDFGEGDAGEKIPAAIALILREVEADAIAVMLLPDERRARAQRALEAQVLGLIELGRLYLKEAQRAIVISSIRTAFSLIRAIVLKV